ncbi:MAG: hypothetical protein L3J31_07435 [Bacteroidales bacterium]|nr:hypothetical protein [Bacteroidales bacterium]
MYRIAASRLEPILQRVCLSLFLLFIVFSSQAQVFFNNLEDTTRSGQWIGLQTIDSGFAYSGTRFSLVDSQQPYGLGLEGPFPETIRGKNVLLKISGWVTSEVVFDKAVFVVSLKEGDEDLLWKGTDLGPLITESNHWFRFADSVNIPGSVSETATIKAYLWNSDGKHRMGIDDLKFEFVAIQNPSFFPQVSEDKFSPGITGNPIFIGSYYTVYYQKKDKTVRIAGNDGNPIIKNIWYFSERLRGKKRKKKQSALRFIAVDTLGNKTELYFVGKGVELKLSCEIYRPLIQIEVVSNYKRNQEFTRQSLLMKSGQAVEEVYRKNRKTDVKNFQDEYWLDKEGVRFGNKESSWIVYHNPNISSLQLKPSDSLLAVNLDYEKDHPFLHFPLDEDTVDIKEDWSSSKYADETTRQFSFSIFVGTKARNLPRFMKNPNGFLATYIWTEHADWTDIRTNRAIYFGSEKIRNAKEASGGFVFYNIPVTKSVFWANPDKISNAEISRGSFGSQESTVMDDADFHTFLKEIHSLGHDICLHTPEQFTTTPERLEDALAFMQSNFASPSWIDHGYNNKNHNNREDLICDGSIEKSAYFALNLWEKYGLKYFWNAYYEEYFPFSALRFSNNLEKPYSGFGDYYPKPDFWQHPSRTASIYHWPTTSVLYVAENRLWNYHFSTQVLHHFVDDWAVEINHCYPAWVDPSHGFWLWDNDSTIVAAPGFNNTLQRMAALRDEGKLKLTTIRDFLNYRLAIEQLSYEILRDGTVRVSNSSDMAIKGLSFATRSRLLLVDGLRPSQKLVGEDVVFWFDLGAGESKLIRVFE